MIVVADTTPLRYLIVIEQVHLLPALYGRVLIPPAVAAELNQPNSPAAVRDWLAMEPAWLEIRKPTLILEPQLQLDEGEKEAIALAQELGADVLLVDEWDARQEASRRRLRIVGTLRILADGAIHNLADLEEAFERLQNTNFRISPVLLKTLLAEYHREKRNISPA